jgi:hypothetical protein
MKAGVQSICPEKQNIFPSPKSLNSLCPESSS